MGRRVVALVMQDPATQLAAAIDAASHPLLGQDAGAVAGESSAGITIRDDWAGDADTVIDFSLPSAIDACIQQCMQHRQSLVVATTGLSSQQKTNLESAAREIPIVWAPSMSLAVNLTMKITQQISRTLRDVEGGVDVEIIERHHRFKADAPSGTALRFGELVAGQLNARNGDDGGDDGQPRREVQHVHGRHGETGQRTRDEIGYHAVRVGDDPGRHTIVFGMMGEKIELDVSASSRDCYASGAITAAKFLRDKPAGLYNMFDVLGISADD
ncbi:MAG: 4-hydroxy-tetrahydrodipicolinate reductase [Planctomycetota bacterium]